MLFRTTEDFIKEINLSSNKALRSIYLGDIVLSYLEPSRHRCVFAVLSQITSTALREISLSITLNNTAELDGFDWDPFGQLLEKQIFAHLQCLRIWIVGRVEAEEVKKLLRLRLLKCHRRGIIAFN